MPTSAIPIPPSMTPRGMSAGRGFWSEKWPKSGCTIEELRVAARTRKPAAAKESPRSATRNGTRAATAPWLTSVKRCPAERTAIALLSTPFFAPIGSLIDKSGAHAMVTRVRVSGVGRDDVADPAEQATRTDPQAWRDDEPQDTGQEATIVELPDSGDD